MGMYGYICAFDPRHPARAHQEAERLRWRDLDMSWDRRRSSQWVCEREQHFTDEQAVERAIELQEQDWAARGLEICEREIDIAIGCSAREPQLEREIRASENPESALEVYAEWLQCQGDPRGFVAALDLARQRVQQPDERERLDRAFREALVEHGFHLFGPHAESIDLLQLEWSGGMVFGFWRDRAAAPNIPRPASWPSELFELPIFACLRTLTGELDYYSMGVLTRPESELLAGLRVLECGHFGALAGAHLPRLEQLEWTSGSGGSLRLPALRRLNLRVGSLGSLGRALVTLSKSELPKLEDLTLWVSAFRMSNHGPVPGAPDEILAEMLALPVIARLRRFTLLNLEPDHAPWYHEMSRVLILATSLRHISRVELRLSDFDANTRSWLRQQAGAYPNWYLD